MRNQDLTGSSATLKLELGVPTAQWGDVMIGYEMAEFPEVGYEGSDYGLWKDMFEEPEKYGDDIEDWLELDETVARWRRAAYWLFHEENQLAVLKEEQAPWKEVFTPIAKQCAKKCYANWVDRDVKAFVTKIRKEKSATKIQAIVRGFLVRSKVSLDCCMCLAHKFSPFKTDVGNMCYDCKCDGPYTDIIDNDPWSWFRGECKTCLSNMAQVGDECAACYWDDKQCLMCHAPVERQGDFCDPECEREYKNEVWRE